MDQYAHVLFKERFMYAPMYVSARMCGYIHAQRLKKGALSLYHSVLSRQSLSLWTWGFFFVPLPHTPG